MWSVCDPDLESMVSFSTRFTGLTKLNTDATSICRRFIYPIYGSGRSLLIIKEKYSHSFFFLK
jgi:hypothetical protein